MLHNKTYMKHDETHEEHQEHYETRLSWSIGVTLIVFAGEIVGGIVSNSLALLSDAGHVFTDVFALGLSLVALHIMRRPSNYRATYGYQRIGLLAALVNGCTLVLISVLSLSRHTKGSLHRPKSIRALCFLWQWLDLWAT